MCFDISVALSILYGRMSQKLRSEKLLVLVGSKMNRVTGSDDKNIEVYTYPLSNKCSINFAIIIEDLPESFFLHLACVDPVVGMLSKCLRLSCNGESLNAWYFMTSHIRYMLALRSTV